MAMALAVGGARRAFEESFANEGVLVLDQAFGAEGDWELAPLTEPGELTVAGWSLLVDRAVEALGGELVPNLESMAVGGRGVFLPANVQAIAFQLSAGHELRCASLPGLRNELADLARHWSLPLDENALRAIIGGEPPEEHSAPFDILETFARVCLAANEAARRDCPLWLIVS